MHPLAVFVQTTWMDWCRQADTYFQCD